MNWYMYRINGGEVLTSSTEELLAPDQYFGVITDETSFDLATAYWSDGNTIRAATQQEIDNFPIAETEDKVSQQKSAAEDFFDSADNNAEVRAIIAIFELFADEINKLRANAGLNEYTSAQMKNAVKNAINNA